MPSCSYIVWTVLSLRKFLLKNTTFILSMCIWTHVHTQRGSIFQAAFYKHCCPMSLSNIIKSYVTLLFLSDTKSQITALKVTAGHRQTNRCAAQFSKTGRLERCFASWHINFTIICSLPTCGENTSLPDCRSCYKLSAYFFSFRDQKDSFASFTNWSHEHWHTLW